MSHSSLTRRATPSESADSTASAASSTNTHSPHDADGDFGTAPKPDQEPEADQEPEGRRVFEGRARLDEEEGALVAKLRAGMPPTPFVSSFGLPRDSEFRAGRFRRV